MEEIWKPVVEFEGLYEVSSLGRVRNKEKIIFKGYVTEHGYLQFSFSKNKKRYRDYAHRVVAKAFIEGDFSLTVNHINGDKTNNSVENLEWCSLSENNHHAYKTGLKNNTGKNNPAWKGYIINTKTNQKFTTVAETASFYRTSQRIIRENISGLRDKIPLERLNND